MFKFYDFEVFKKDWLVVIIDPTSGEYTTIVNDKDALEKFYDKHKHEIWVGYNSAHYDQYIFKSILLGMDPKEVNDAIIVKGMKGWQVSRCFWEIPLINFDVFHPKTDRGLKTHEAYMGNSIQETSVPFDIDRKLTEQELEDVVKYCTHDVEQTIEVFQRRYSEFEAKYLVVKEFDLPLSYLGKTEAQLTATVLDAAPPRKDRGDEFDLEVLDCIELGPYSFLRDWYLDEENHDYSRSIEFDLAGCPHICAWGGLHGALQRYTAEGYFVLMDVTSYYPSLMIEHSLLSRNVANAAKFKQIYDERVELKAKKDPRQAAMKLLLNATYGASKDKYNRLYDPRQANMVCMNGQLMLVDLMQHLVKDAGAEIVQSNTDGVLVKMPESYEREYGDKAEDEFFSAVDDVAAEWEERTGMRLEFDEYRRVFQKDVNNYVLVAADGSIKSKGAYVKKLGELDYDLAVVNKAIVERMVNGVPVEETILGDNDLIDFQRVVKVSGKYSHAVHGSKRLNDKCFRVFASKDKHDGAVGKVKRGKDRPEKFAVTSEHSFIVNSDVHGLSCPQKLDRRWYIDLAKDRLSQFGVV